MKDKNGQRDDSVSRIKTGSFERRLSLTKAGLFAGTRMATHTALGIFSGKEARARRRKEMLSRQALFLVEELGKLKGSVVKIGQVMALYGEHFLPVEVTEALHTLEDKTVSLSWDAIHEVLVRELGSEKISELEIERKPIGAASLGQVHRAVRKSDGKELCLKIQYPGVAEAVDSDLDSVASLLKLAKVVSFGPDFDEWLEEVRQMMHREVNYRLEAETTKRFRQMLEGDERFIVPEVFFEYTTSHVMATSYEPGHSVTGDVVQELSLSRRNHLASAFLELFLREMYDWQELQTDPNFGNYRIRVGDEGKDQIVLLDFGAVQKYPESVLGPVKRMIKASYDQNLPAVIEGGIELNFMQRNWPESVLNEFGQVCMAVLEPLATSRMKSLPENALNEQGQYRWKESDLPGRVAKRAALSAINRYFKIPPKEFVFLNRKLVGVYTFISVIGAEFNGEDILLKFINRSSPNKL